MILNDRRDFEVLRGTPDFGRALRLILGSTKTWINRSDLGEEPDWEEVTVFDTLSRMEFTMEEFLDELQAAGIAPTTAPAPLVQPATESDYAAAIQAHVDSTARSKGYADGFALAGYATSTIPQWAAESAAFVAWRDAVWVYAYQELAKVQSGERQQPAIKNLVAELPSIIWP